MKILAKRITGVVAGAILALATLFGGWNGAAFAEDEACPEGGSNSVSISPVSKVLSLEARHEYEDTFRITNCSDETTDFEVYAAPYAYTYSEESNNYTLGFSHENAFTQIVRWISFEDTDGNWAERHTYEVEAKSTLPVHYRVATPESVPAGGQYAVIFAHMLSASTTTKGIKVEPSPGLVVYGRAVGDVVTKGNIADVEIHDTMVKDGANRNIINGTARFSNTGNVDYMAKGVLRVTGIFGRVYYETEELQGRTAVIPESEVTLTEAWDDTPFLGIFNVEWSVQAPSITDEVTTVTKTVVILPTIVIIFMILLLTIIIVWIIIMVRKRRERRSKFMV